MADRDFFDEDLVKPRDGVKRIKMGPADQPARTADPDNTPGDVLPVSDFNLTRMVRQKEEISEEVALKARELERLRQRQTDLEVQKKGLEELRSKQSDYESGKRELKERMTQSLIGLEKREIQTSQLADLLGETRRRFREMLNELGEINEENWPDEAFREELNKALAQIDDMRMEFNRSMSRVEMAVGSDDSSPGDHKPVIFEETRPAMEMERNFGYWMKVGLAVSLPLIIFVCIVLAALFLFNFQVWI